MKTYKWVTQAMFDDALETLVRKMSPASLLYIEGVYELISEYLNDLVLEVLEEDHEADFCPICGEYVIVEGKTKDGRLIGSCKDAFTEDQWQSR